MLTMPAAMYDKTYVDNGLLPPMGKFVVPSMSFCLVRHIYVRGAALQGKGICFARQRDFVFARHKKQKKTVGVEPEPPDREERVRFGRQTLILGGFKGLALQTRGDRVLAVGKRDHPCWSLRERLECAGM